MQETRGDTGREKSSSELRTDDPESSREPSMPRIPKFDFEELSRRLPLTPYVAYGTVDCYCHYVLQEAERDARLEGVRCSIGVGHDPRRERPGYACVCVCVCLCLLFVCPWRVCACVWPRCVRVEPRVRCCQTSRGTLPRVVGWCLGWFPLLWRGPWRWCRPCLVSA